MKSRALIVIPARYSSSRFPGKPLVSVLGKPMIQRVWEIASSQSNVRVVVATDHDEIEKCVLNFGGQVVRTDSTCRTGTDRVRQAASILQADEDFIVSFQGDALLTPPTVLGSLLKELEHDNTIEICTPAVLLSGQSRKDFLESKKGGSSSGTTVVFDQKRNALYFSKLVLPFQRDENADESDIYRHIGVYAYRRDVLERFASLPEGRLEAAEKLEQLRALEAGIAIRVVICDLQGRSLLSIDNPEDVTQVEKVIAEQGELLG